MTLFKAVLISGIVGIIGGFLNMGLMAGKSFIQSIGFVAMILGMISMGVFWGYSMGCKEKNT